MRLTTLRGGAFAAATAALLVLVACGGERAAGPGTPTAPAGTSQGPDSPGSSPSPVDGPDDGEEPTVEHLSGTWSGTWRNTAPDEAGGTFELVWEQEGSRLAGALAIDGSACFTRGRASGSVVGTDVRFEVDAGGATAVYRGTVSGGSIAGTYSMSCDGAEGVWESAKSGTRAGD